MDFRMLAETGKTPYYAVIFTSLRSEIEDKYSETAERMLQLAMKEKGFLAFESAREEIGISISYWKSLDAIKKWKENSEHLIAQSLGKEKWYKAFNVRIAKIERDYGFGK